MDPLGWEGGKLKIYCKHFNLPVHQQIKVMQKLLRLADRLRVVATPNTQHITLDVFLIVAIISDCNTYSVSSHCALQDLPTSCFWLT